MTGGDNYQSYHDDLLEMFEEEGVIFNCKFRQIYSNTKYKIIIVQFKMVHCYSNEVNKFIEKSNHYYSVIATSNR